VGDLLCRVAYGSLFLDGLGRVQSTTLPKISVDEAADFIVHRDRMEAPAQECACMKFSYGNIKKSGGAKW
jgi:hypothetical protein